MFKEEYDRVISVMTGKIKIHIVDELINSLENLSMIDKNSNIESEEDNHYKENEEIDTDISDKISINSFVNKKEKENYIKNINLDLNYENEKNGENNIKIIDNSEEIKEN